MFIKYISNHNQSETLINKDKITYIENTSTANNLNRTILAIKIHFEKENSIGLSFNTQDELDDFLRKIEA